MGEGAGTRGEGAGTPWGGGLGPVGEGEADTIKEGAGSMGQGAGIHGGGEAGTTGEGRGWPLRGYIGVSTGPGAACSPISQWMSLGLQETLEPSPALLGPSLGNLLSRQCRKQGQTAQACNQSELFLKVTRQGYVCDVEAVYLQSGDNDSPADDLQTITDSQVTGTCKLPC